jgi:hypothetical protein
MIEDFLLYSDERYLPFEGTGAVSDWEYNMPPETNHFDYGEITDLFITVAYTALNGSPKFMSDVKTLLSGDRFFGATYIDLKEAYLEEWKQFMADKTDPAKQVLTFDISSSSLPPNFKRFVLDAVDFRLVVSGVEMPAKSEFMSLQIMEAASKQIKLEGVYGTLKLAPPLKQQQFEGAWQLVVHLDKMKTNDKLKQLLTEGFLDPDAFEDLRLVIEYRACAFNCT